MDILVSQSVIVVFLLLLSCEVSSPDVPNFKHVGTRVS